MLDLETLNVFEDAAVLRITAIEESPYGTRCMITNTCSHSGNSCASDTDCQGSCSQFSIIPCNTDSDCSGSRTCINSQGLCRNAPCASGAECTEVGDSCAASFNDCDGNFQYFDPSDDSDCDDDGRNDLAVRTATDRTPDVEIVSLNQTQPGSPLYQGELTLSSGPDLDGVLLAQKRPLAIGFPRDPTLTVTYEDIDDGTGQVCRNDVDPGARGRVDVESTLFRAEENVTVAGVLLSDNGDDDGFADDHETVKMRIGLHNGSPLDLTNVTARLFSDDPDVDCISDSVIGFGDLASRETRMSEAAFSFRVGNVGRSDDQQELKAEFTVLLSGDQFVQSVLPQSVTLDLDLDASGGSGPGLFFRGFETGDFGDFTLMHLDAGLGGSATDGSDNDNSDGYRCQYSDPDWINSNSYGTGFGVDCYLNPTGAPDASYWQDTTDRAFSGSRSLYFGIPLSPDLGFTTPLAQLEAVAMTDPVSLGWDHVCSISRTVFCADDGECPIGETCVPATPQLSFKHQLSLFLEQERTVDRTVVQVQLADATDTAVGSWINIAPFLNVYDREAVDFFSNCTFDPIDDGNNEDSFFDPLDPNRDHGPSSTCSPELVWAQQGDTDGEYIGGFARSGSFSDDVTFGPGLRGSSGIGTWVEPVFNLERFRGRRLRVRFLETGIKVGAGADYEQLFAPYNPDPGDDGWWIDDVTITDTLAVPAAVTADLKDNSGLPVCPVGCGAVTALLESDALANTLLAPGDVVGISAVESSADICPDGILQYRFWIDGNGDGLGGDAADTLVRTWTDDPDFIDAPSASTSYVADVRCSSDTACADSRALTVTVQCPSSGNLGGVFQTITAPDPNSFVWTNPADATFAKGDLGGVAGYVTSDTGPLVAATSLDISADNPAAGAGLWYLLKSVGIGGSACNEVSTWISGGAGEQPGRDTALP